MTLTGAGGVGKTRLAVEIGFSAAPHFPDGVWFVDLAPLSGVDSIFTEVAAAVSIPFQPKPITEVVLDWLESRQLLLILDNCEHILTPVITLVDAVLGHCATVAILTTSREPLGLPGERIVRVASMTTSGRRDTLRRTSRRGR